MYRLLFFIYILVKSAEAGCFLKPNTQDCRLTLRNLYDFGPGAGDQALPKTDDHFVSIKTPGNFKFYDRFYSTFFLSTNGAVELKENNDAFELHDKFESNSVSFPIADHAIIAPFWSDHTPGLSSEVFYRVATDDETLEQISYEVNLHKPTSYGMDFMPTWSCIVTWYQLKAFNHRRLDSNNTFQLVLASNGEMSYVMFNYGDLHWPNNDVKVSVSVGYNSGDNQTFFQKEHSASVNISELQHKSNVGMRSRWMYRVDEFTPGLVEKVNVLKYMSPESFSFFLFVAIIIGISSIFNTVMWVVRLLQKSRRSSPFQMAYSKQLDDSRLVLNYDI